VTALRLLLTGLGLLGVALLVVSPFGGAWFEPSVLSVRGWSVLALTAVGAGLVVAAALVSALTAEPRRTTPEPEVDHFR
jgi:hypothetical protein